MKQLQNIISTTILQYKEEITKQELIKSHFKYDSSSIIIDPKKWNSYSKSLILSLGLTINEDKNKILSMKINDSNQWTVHDFFITHDCDSTYTQSFIKLFFIFDIEIRKIRICFFRIRSDQTLNTGMKWDHNSKLIASLEYQTCIQALKQLVTIPF